MNQKQCDIVQDLLTLYADSLTSTSSNEMIEEHLQSCDDCKAVLEQYKQPIAVESFPQKEVDYLKKVRKRIIVGRIISGFFVLIFVSVLLHFFVIGSLISWDDTKYDLTTTFCEESNTITLSATLSGTDKAVSFVRVSTTRGHSNIKQIYVYRVFSSFIHNDNSFTVTVPYSDDLVVEMQGSGEKAQLYNRLLLLPHILEVKNGEMVYGNLFDTREIGNEIKAIVAAATDTGIKSGAPELQVDSYIRVTIAESGQYTLPSELPPETIEFEYSAPKTVIFIYELDNNYYAEIQGGNIRQLTAEDYNNIHRYLENLKLLD